MRLIDNFIGEYSLSKTIRMGLKPIGKTRENIEQFGVLERDESLAEDAKKVKPIIDRFILSVIDKGLSTTRLEGLDQYMEVSAMADSDALKKVQGELRKQTINAIKNTSEYKDMFKADLIKKLLPEFTDDKEEKELISHFERNTGYFSDFLKNRGLLFAEDEKHGSLSYRIVHENLPKYINNMNIFKVLSKRSDFFLKKIVGWMQDELSISDIPSFFTLDGFNDTLTQKGIEAYNLMISGKSLEDGKKIKGFNEYINEYNQTCKGERLPKFAKLFKQILSPVNTFSFVAESITEDKEVFELVNGLRDILEQNVFESEDTVSPYELFTDIKGYDLSGIYVPEKTASAISHYLFSDWGYLRKAITKQFVNEAIAANPKLANKPTKKFLKEKEKAHTKPHSIYELDLMSTVPVEDYFVLYIKEIYDRIKASEQKYSSIKWDFSRGSKLQNSNKTVLAIKDYLDNLKDLEKLVKSMALCNGVNNYDVNFYSNISILIDNLKSVNSVYNKIRNYLTKKPYSKEKIKLTFDCGQLLDGWSKTVEDAKRGVIFYKDGFYYLGIISAAATKCLADIPPATSKNVYKKMDYMLLKGSALTLPHVIFGSKRCDGGNVEFYDPSEEIKEIYSKELFKTDLDACHKLIDFYKTCIEKNDTWKIYNFKFSDTSSYKGITEFYKEVDDQGYTMTFRDVDASYINRLVDNSDLYLFQIYNKDFAPNAKGTPDIYTLYLKSLFNVNNIKDRSIRLNGGAEIFYRKKSIKEEDMIVHKAGKPIPTKNPNADHKESVFKYDIIKDRRYTYDGFEFHFPIAINAVAGNYGFLNNKVNNLIRTSDEVNVMGIDISERGLVSYVVIDQKGHILEQKSLNVINGVDYYELLARREREMDEAQANWAAIGSIKELKEGYLSLALNLVVSAMIEYNTVIFIENFTTGFKRERQKADKQIYQIFATKLIKKLNYCFDKHKEYSENGGILKGYQLTNKFESLTKLGYQTGFLFNISSWRSSSTDPTTGFISMRYTPYENRESSRKYIDMFENIRFNGEYFEFVYPENDRKWTICTFGERYDYTMDVNGQMKCNEHNLTKEFINLFSDYDIDYRAKDLKEKIREIDSKDFFERFHKLFNLTNQMINYGKGDPYFISPVKNSHGEFFDTRKAKDAPNSIYTLGAYNMAKKGLWTVRKIKEIKEDEQVPFLDSAEWMAFVSENTL